MVGCEVDDITSSLRQVQIQSEIIEGDHARLVGRQVEVVIATEVVQGIVGEIITPTSTSISLRVPPSVGASTSTPLSASTPFLLFPLATSRLTTQWWREPRTKVLGPRSIEYWRRRAGYNAIQALKA